MARLFNRVVNITFQIIAGAFYTLVVYYVGTFNPNHFIMRDFPDPSFHYSNNEQYVDSLNSSERNDGGFGSTGK